MVPIEAEYSMLIDLGMVAAQVWWQGAWVMGSVHSPACEGAPAIIIAEGPPCGEGSVFRVCPPVARPPPLLSGACFVAS